MEYDPRLRFLEAIPTNNRILLTSRVRDYDEIGQKATLNGAVTLQPLSDDQFREYLVGFPKIDSAIQTDNQLRELARTPLLLSLVAFAWDQLDNELKTKGDLLTSDVRNAIFEAYCYQRYHHESRKINAALSFSYLDMMDILGELAMWNTYYFGEPLRRLRKRDRTLILGFSGVIESDILNYRSFVNVLWLPRSVNISTFQKMMSDLNLLVAISDQEYRFIHLLLRDYLAYTFAYSLIYHNDQRLRDGWINPQVPVQTLKSFGLRVEWPNLDIRSG